MYNDFWRDITMQQRCRVVWSNPICARAFAESRVWLDSDPFQLDCDVLDLCTQNTAAKCYIELNFCPARHVDE